MTAFREITLCTPKVEGSECGVGHLAEGEGENKRKNEKEIERESEGERKRGSNVVRKRAELKDELCRGSVEGHVTFLIFDVVL